MKVDFGRKLIDLKGKQITVVVDDAGPRPADLKLVTLTALLNVMPSDQGLMGQKKYEFYKLAAKIEGGNKTETAGQFVIEVTAEEITTIKERVGAMFGPQVIGPAYEALEIGASTH